MNCVGVLVTAYQLSIGDEKISESGVIWGIKVTCSISGDMDWGYPVLNCCGRVVSAFSTPFLVKYM